MVRGDGNGWIRCEQGHRHWGVHGAAGLLLRRRGGSGSATASGGDVVLLQHRASWTSDGDTWGLPGGARDSHESPVQAALREAGEEAGIDPAAVQVAGEWPDDHGGWVYVTVIAEVIGPLSIAPNAESAELRWVVEPDVETFALHPGFARTWPLLRYR
jgi:8-oxo-dGTP diphosphatase